MIEERKENNKIQENKLEVCFYTYKTAEKHTKNNDETNLIMETKNETATTRK